MSDTCTHQTLRDCSHPLHDQYWLSCDACGATFSYQQAYTLAKARIAALEAKLAELQRAKFGTPCKCESWMARAGRRKNNGTQHWLNSPRCAANWRRQKEYAAPASAVGANGLTILTIPPRMW